MPIGYHNGNKAKVLKLAALGLSSKQIGLALGINHNCVDQHLHQGLHRLGLRNRCELTAYLLTINVIRLSDFSINPELIVIY